MQIVEPASGGPTSDRVLGEIALRNGRIRHTRRDTTLFAVGIAQRAAVFLPEDGSPGGFTLNTVGDKLLVTTHDVATFRGYVVSGTKVYAMRRIED
jgi:hypothetical protein